ncbi:Gfo/Idh/MocA family protein [Miniimonas arenae]|uniref:Gfo/Idh/MocA family protein n=1 Tax=Miniimonas arenae TaxID=676201 RepID=UPI0028A7C526|nr:Gfo/Idh/MocA family oxidoreductase [Miniimonas arenae]
MSAGVGGGAAPDGEASDAAHVRWAVLGPGAISRDFVTGLQASATGVLHAVGSRDAGRAAAFAAEHGAPVAGEAHEILARDDVDAVYVGTVHPAHLELAVAALEAGKAVLCEKPLTPSAADTAQLLAAAAQAGVPFVEAFKYRFGPYAHLLRRLVEEDVVGRPLELHAAMGFTAGSKTGRLFDPALAGGAILDVGCYPVSLAVAVAAWAGLLDAADGEGEGEPRRLGVRSAVGHVGETGVDERAEAVLAVGGLDARVATAIVADLPRDVVLRGSAGWIDLPDVWGSRTESGTRLVVHADGEPPFPIQVPVVQPMAAEADAVAAALAAGRGQAPEMPWAESAVIAGLLEDWRRALD